VTMMHDCAVVISNAGLIVISLFFAWRLQFVRDVGCSMEKANFRIREIYVLHMHLQGDQDAPHTSYAAGIGHHAVQFPRDGDHPIAFLWAP
jgi:hypothetical protein